MRNLSPVVWSEGMHLAQHHFQLQSRYFQDSAAFALETLFADPWGLVSCELDDEALLNGTVSVLRAHGVFPDGLAFQIPEDPTPEPLEIRERFSPTRNTHVVALAVPPYRPEGANVSLGEVDDGVRYRAAELQVVDEASGTSTVDVRVGLKNLRLHLDDDVPEDAVSLPLARIRRDGSGRFVYDRDYVPPALQIRGSRGLVERLRRLVEVLEEKARTVGGSGADLGDASRYSGSQVAAFWFGHALHSSLPALRHHLATRTSHPEELYLELARLAGALCTFTSGLSAADLAAYDHRDLETTFDGLDRHIRRNLDIVKPSGAVRMKLGPLERGDVPADVGAVDDDYFSKATVRDPRCLSPGADWWLVVKPGGSAADVVERTPRLVKICSAGFIVKLVKKAREGLALEYVESPPAALSPRVGQRYFRIAGRTNQNPCWRHIVDTGQIGVYTPQSLAGATFEIAVLTES
jgi:type VI secretion system protein ImpJ